MNLLFNLKMLVLLGIIIIQASCANSQKKEKSMTKKHTYTNELIKETSPYLLQHAHNPVNWMAWGDEAFEKAKKEDKLVLVSIGYSSCHWCHVMEHESFEDEEVAKLMNDYFVCIKVDREERPDVDQIYMTAVQLMTGSGGWPLNCFTLPDGRPIYGGTYFKKNEWIELLNNLHNTYTKDKQRMLNYAQNLTQGIQQSELIASPVTPSEFNMEIIEEVAVIWKRNFDSKDGGMNRAPKFPLPNNWDYLQQYALFSLDSTIMHQVDLTLKKMAFGGIYDQIGGGFSRYSTDVKWKVPHFEKMLYDNAQLVSLYVYAYQRSKKPLYKKVVYQTLEWVYREMTTSNGAFYSALDADSEGEEGKFYVWSKQELKEVLTDSEFEILQSYYEINPKALWEGSYILLRDSDVEFDKELEQKMSKINKKLLKVRNNRVKPALDDKSLTTWNAMMLKAYVDAYTVFGESMFLQAAFKNADWIEKHQTQVDGGLYHTYKNGTSKIDGFLDDYVFTIDAYLSLYEATFDEKWIVKAKQLTDYAIKHFEDDETGMFYYTSNTSAKLIARKMEINDNVIPASNSQMAKVLFKLGKLLANTSYLSKSKQMLSNVFDSIYTYPSGYSNWSMLALYMINPYYEVAITGREWKDKLEKLNQHYIPNKVVMGGEQSTLELLKGKFLNETTIFICQEGACKMPVTKVAEAVKQMR
ncbi:MAG TPA: thioredoxin domain-containing protein [Crocinitomix sp.]|nr:thioredoxin domain-containing protein [Crocinitomix sp.]